jgi:hypothetical protein
LALLPALALPSPAMANAYTQVEQAYSASSTGALSPCAFSSTTLEAALKQAPAYDYQYGADITDAIQAALSARADGECRTGPAAAVAGSLGSGVQLKSADTALPGSVDSAASGGLPLVLVIAFALAGAGLLVLGVWLGAGALGFDPRLRRAARHSLREAEYRMSAGWDDLTDRLRR